MEFYDVPVNHVNQSIPTEANRGLTSYSVVEAFCLLFVIFSLRLLYSISVNLTSFQIM
jgi:hypothetical protein